MRVAVIHDWLTGMRGGERVLEAILELIPDAELFTLVHRRGSVSRIIEDRPIHTSWLDRLPGAHTRYRHFLPLLPSLIERFDLRRFDAVVSSSHCVAHGVRRPPDVPHLCYCHSPMRYIWDRYDDYFGPGRAAPWVRAVAPFVAQRLRRWDVRAASRLTACMANSRHVRDRIRRCWHITADVVPPPVDVDRFRPAASRDDFYLVVSALVPYKRIDLAVQAFAGLDRRLVVIGTGPEMERLRAMATRNVEFLGWRDDAEVEDYLARCRAFVMPAHEDFGIAAVEAQAAGAPVIAYGAGGALETVRPAPDEHHVMAAAPSRRKPVKAVAGVQPVPSPWDASGDLDGGSGGADWNSARQGFDDEGGGFTGVFFWEQSPAALADAVRRFETLRFDPAALRANARRFDRPVFMERMRARLRSELGIA